MHTHDEYCNNVVARRVMYEFDMFAYLGKQLDLAHRKSTADFVPGDITMMRTGDPANDLSRVTAALLESFLLHTRVLLEFFYKDRPRDGDVLASHFVEHWKVLRSPEPRYLLDHKHQLDKALAHLTLARVDYDRQQKKWNVTAIQEEVNGLIALFKLKLTEERRGWFAFREDDPLPKADDAPELAD